MLYPAELRDLRARRPSGHAASHALVMKVAAGQRQAPPAPCVAVPKIEAHRRNARTLTLTADSFGCNYSSASLVLFRVCVVIREAGAHMPRATGTAARFGRLACVRLQSAFVRDA